jgi:hypothetical protein
MADIEQEAHNYRHANNPVNVPFGDLFKRRIVITADEHAAVNRHEDAKYIRAHLYRLA